MNPRKRRMAGITDGLICMVGIRAPMEICEQESDAITCVLQEAVC